MTQLMEQIKEKDAQAFTHSGKFHADDVFSAALLLSVNPEITICRGRRILRGLSLISEEENTTIIRGIAESVKMVCHMRLSGFYGKSWVLRF